MAAKPTIGRAEMAILNYIHRHSAVTVRDVADHFSETRGYVRTTVLNVMVRLCHKGYLQRKRGAGGVYRYWPRVPKRKLMRGLVRDFVEKTLGGSVSPFVAYLAEDANLSAEDVEELKAVVRGLDVPAADKQLRGETAVGRERP